MAKAKHQNKTIPMDNTGVMAVTLGGISLGNIIAPGTIILAGILGLVAFIAAKNVRLDKGKD